MFRKSTNKKRQLIPFHPLEFKNNPSLLMMIFEDYMGFYWEQLKRADEGVIQRRFEEYTGRTVPLTAIRNKRKFMSDCYKMINRNEQSRRTGHRKAVVRHYTQVAQEEADAQRRGQNQDAEDGDMNEQIIQGDDNNRVVIQLQPNDDDVFNDSDEEESIEQSSNVAFYGGGLFIDEVNNSEVIGQRQDELVKRIREEKQRKHLTETATIKRMNAEITTLQDSINNLTAVVESMQDLLPRDQRTKMLVQNFIDHCAPSDVDLEFNK